MFSLNLYLFAKLAVGEMQKSVADPGFDLRGAWTVSTGVVENH